MVPHKVVLIGNLWHLLFSFANITFLPCYHAIPVKLTTLCWIIPQRCNKPSLVGIGENIRISLQHSNGKIPRILHSCLALFTLAI
jgi:hypothetical protein